MNTNNHKTFEALMGAFVVLVFAGFLTFSYTQSNTSFKQGYTLNARFDRVDGLLTGNDVRVNGVKVGEVRSISLDPQNYLALVKFDVTKDIQVPEDSIAQITSDGLLGGKFLSLQPGTSTDHLPSHAEITQTQSSVSLEGMISQFIFNSSGSSDNSKSSS